MEQRKENRKVPNTSPEMEDYLKLFQMYDEDLAYIYQEAEDERYALLFEQCVRLLVKSSHFNYSLTKPFRPPAKAKTSYCLIVNSPTL